MTSLFEISLEMSCSSVALVCYFTSIKWEEPPKYVKPWVLDIQTCSSLKISLNCSCSLTWEKSTNIHDIGCLSMLY